MRRRPGPGRGLVGRRRPEAQTRHLRLHGLRLRTGYLDYKGSIKIRARNRYEHAFGRTHARLTDKTRGTYKRKRSLLIFKKGAMDETKARLKPGTGEKREPHLELLLDGKPSEIFCCFVPEP